LLLFGSKEINSGIAGFLEETAFSILFEILVCEAGKAPLHFARFDLLIAFLSINFTVSV